MVSEVADIRTVKTKRKKRQAPANRLKIALVGNPNSGKSSVFNALTGLNQKVANFPGVTVDKRIGYASLKTAEGNIEAEFLDLPGAYSLYPKSPEEKVP